MGLSKTWRQNAKRIEVPVNAETSKKKGLSFIKDFTAKSKLALVPFIAHTL